jgi:hypothetical protein
MMCACLGPQNGEPLCPCQMRAARRHDVGRVVFNPAPPRGCICPPGAEKTCRGAGCPRQPFNMASAAVPSYGPEH